MNISLYKKIPLLILIIFGVFVYIYKPLVVRQLFSKVQSIYETLPAVLFGQRFNFIEQELVPIDTEEKIIEESEVVNSKSTQPKKSYVMESYTQYREITKENILVIINEERNKNKLRSLRLDHELGLSAQKKADEMLEKGYFSHQTPDGKDFTYFIDYGGYEFIRVSENLARGDFVTSRDVVLAWMNSPTHKSNIFDGTMIDTGIGIVLGMYKGKEQYMVVQHFGRPRGACPLIDRSLEPDIKIMTAQGKVLYTEIRQTQEKIDTILSSDPSILERESAKTMEKELEVKISEYNAVVDTLQELTTKYNTQVKAFNDCNTSYYAR
jgi:uncharacterized protein YkwD